MILDLLYEKKNIITFSDFDKSLDWRKYQSYSVWEGPFYWKAEGNGTTEWLKINAIDVVKLIKIDMDFSRTFDRIRVMTSLDNQNWDVLWDDNFLPEEDKAFKNKEFIFLKFEFVNVRDYVEVNKLHIYVEDYLDYDKRWLSHNIDILLPHMIKLKKTRMNWILEGFLKMLERNTVKTKPCRINDVQFGFGCFDVKTSPEIKGIVWDSNELYGGGVYIMKVLLKERANVSVFFNYRGILVEKIDWNEFRISFPEEPGIYEMKIIVDKNGLFTTYKTQVEVR